jgi:hypothetical protein
VLGQIVPDEPPVFRVIGPSAWTNWYGGVQMLVVYADGRAFRTPVVFDPPMGEPPAWFERSPLDLIDATTITQDQVAQIQTSAENLLALDYGREDVKGDETTSVTVNGTTASVYAFRYNGGTLTDEQIANRQKLSLFLVATMKTVVNAPPTNVSDDAIIVRIRDEDRSVSAEPATKVWKLPVSNEIVKSVTKDHAVCVVYRQSEIGFLNEFEEIFGSPSGHYWLLGGRRLIVDVRVALPHERTCDDDITVPKA